MAVVGAFMVPHPPLIIPEIGHGQEKMIPSTVAAYQEAAGRIARLCPDTIVILSPHTAMYADYFHISPGQEAKGNFGMFQAEQVTIKKRLDEVSFPW